MNIRRIASYVIRTWLLINLIFFTPYAITGSAKQIKKGSKVYYSTLFANYQHNNRIDALCTAKGKVEWFTTVKNPQGTFPSVIITDGIRYYLQYHNNLVRFDLKGSILWSKEIQSHMTSMISKGNVYYSNGSTVYCIDDKQAQKTNPFFVPNCGDRGQILFIAPLNGTTHIVQTFKLAPEPKPGKTPQNIWSLSLFDSSGTDSWVNEYTDGYRPAVLTKDMSLLVLPSASGPVHLMDPMTGQERSTFTLKDRGIYQVSLDDKDNLTVFGNTLSGTPYILKCDLKGAIAWEINLPSTQLRSFLQPPATDATNRTFVINADSLVCIGNEGTIEWTKGLLHDPDFEYVTILGDNAAIVASGNMVQLLAPDGIPHFIALLPEGERISTPPVVDAEGHVLLGTSNGIYRIK
jgi:outer membrane protein assembly factor BamB